MNQYGMLILRDDENLVRVLDERWEATAALCKRQGDDPAERERESPVLLDDLVAAIQR